MTECAPTTAAAPDGPTGVGLLAGEQPGLEVLGRFGLWRRGDPRGAARCRAHPDDQADPAPERGAGRVHIHDFRIDHQAGTSDARWAPPRRSPARVGSASPAGARVARCAGAAPPPRVAAPSTCTPRGRATRRPPPRGDPQLPAELPALAADGGTLAGLAGRRRLPTGARPRDPAQCAVVVAAGRRGQPAPAAGSWPDSPAAGLGTGLIRLGYAVRPR